jgi:hypothetical protein
MIFLRRPQTPNARPVPLPQLLLGAGFLLLALLLGALVGLGAGRLLVPALLGLLGFAALTIYGLRGPHQGVLTAVLLMVFAVTLLHPLAEASARAPIGYVFELLCFAWLAGALVQALQRHGSQPALRALLIALLLYLLMGVVSSVFGRSHLLAGVWQLQYNLKWPAMLLVGMLLAFGPQQERTLRLVAYWLWLPILAFVALEIAKPALHWRLLGLLSPDLTPNPLLGFGLRRQGPFPHSGYLALTAAGLAWVSGVQLLLQPQGRRWRWGLPLAMYLGLLALSGQRQEAAALVGAVLLGALVLLRRHWRLLLVYGTLAAGVLFTLALIFEVSVAQKLVAQWGGGERLAEVSERYVLSKAGLQIAHDWFPLGSGLGTYGGAGAQKFDQSLFIEMGFEKYWWFRQGSFLVDTYWPSVLAEVGWFGAAGLAAAFLVVLLTMFRFVWSFDARDTIVWTGLGLLVILLLNSPTSASISDPRGAFWMWLMIGAGFARSLALQPIEQRRPGTRTQW